MSIPKRLTSKHFFYLMSLGVGLLLVLCAATVIVGNGMLAKKTSKLTELRLENRVIDEQKVALTQAQKDIEKYAELERIAKQVVPQDKDQVKAVREIIKFAQETGVGIAGINFPSSTLGQAPVAAPKTNSTSEDTATPAKPVAPPVTQVKPVEGLTGVYQMEITVQSVPDTASFPKLIQFLRKLEGNRRTSQVSSLNISPNQSNRNILSFNMIINVYIKP